jgi:hypothetical protein
VTNAPVGLLDPSGLEEVDLEWLSGWLNELAQDNPNNPLIAIPAGTLVGPAALLDGTVFRGIHASACECRRGIENTIAKSHDPIQKGVGVIALGYGYVGEGFAMFGAAEGASAPISAGIGIAFAPVVAVRTPYGTAIQSSSAAAMETRVAVQQGATVFKGGVLGRSEAAASQFLATECPLNAGFAGRYGLPAKNSAFDFILIGRVRPGAPVITRPAPGIPPNPGGGIEAVVNPGDFIIEVFHMP